MSRLFTDVQAALPELSKLVLSQPVDKTGESKISVRPILLKNRLSFQVESFSVFPLHELF